MANGNQGLAPGLSGFRTQRRDKMQRQQHGMEMAQARQGMQATAQQMRQRRLQIEQMKMQNEQFRANEALREAQREQNVTEAELATMNAQYGIENFEETKALERRQQQIELLSERADAQQSFAEANQVNQEIRLQANEYIADQIPNDASQITQRRLRRIRRGVEAMGENPDDLGLPQQVNDATRASLMQRKNQAIQTLEHQRNLDEQTHEQMVKPAEDQIVRLQQHRSQLMRAYEQIEDKDSPEAQRLEQQISEINGRIEEGNAVTGRTPTDARFGSDNMQSDLIARINTANTTIRKIDEMIANIEQDPSLAGPTGMARGMAQTLTGQARDLSSYFTGNGIEVSRELTDAAANDFQREVNSGRVTEALAERNMFDPNLPEITHFENAVKYRLARLRKPTGRLNTQDIQNAAQSIQIQGATSAQEVLTRLNSVREEILERRRNIQAQRQGQTNPYNPNNQYRSEMESRNQEVAAEQEMVNFQTLAEEQFGSDVVQIEQDGEGNRYGRLEDNRIINSDGTVVAHPDLPDSINAMGAQYVEQEFRGPNGQRIFQMADGYYYDSNGNRIEVEE